MGILVSAQEPATLREIGVVSSLPESYGADFLIPTPTSGFVAVQRKTVRDFIASVADGRLHEGLMKMADLPIRILLIEGFPNWDVDGRLRSVSNDELQNGRASYTQFRQASWSGLLLSVQSRGTWVMHTGTMKETGVFMGDLEKWAKKDSHTSLDTRPGPGVVTKRGWQVHFLQGFRGIGPETAGSIVEHFGEIPLEFTVSEKELVEVPGVGKTRAKQMLEALGG